jgi:excisionase family DNA binding protein
MTWDPSRRLLTIQEAARSVGRPASTVRRWLSEGRITPTAWQGRSPLILEEHVLECDADTANKAGSTVRGA